jgi:hypothetical protein
MIDLHALFRAAKALEASDVHRAAASRRACACTAR